MKKATGGSTLGRRVTEPGWERRQVQKKRRAGQRGKSVAMSSLKKYRKSR